MLPSASDRANRSSHRGGRARRGESCKKRRSNFNRLFAQNGPFLPDGHPSGRRPLRLRIREKGVACFALLCLERGSCVRTMVRPFEYGDGNLSRLMQMRLDAHRGIASLQRGPDSSVQSDGDGLTFAFNGG